MGELSTLLLISIVAAVSAIEAKRCFDVQGQLVPVFTTVDDNGTLYLDNIKQYAQFLKDNGMNGVIIASTTGEGPTLNVTDNKKLLDAWMEAAVPLGLYVISDVGAVPLPDAVEMTKYSELIRVDAILALPEVYYKAETVEELVYYLGFIAEAAPNTPLLYDHYPQYSGVEVDMVEFFKQATEKFPNFKGVKSDDFETTLLLQDLVQDDQRIYPANYLYLAAEVYMGFDSFVIAEMNLFPRLINAIIKNGQNGYLNESRVQYRRLVDLRDLITEDGNPIAAMKEAMPMVTGIDVGPARPPIVPLTPDEVRDLEERLKGAEIPIVKSSIDEYN